KRCPRKAKYISEASFKLSPYSIAQFGSTTQFYAIHKNAPLKYQIFIFQSAYFEGSLYFLLFLYNRSVSYRSGASQLNHYTHYLVTLPGSL
ncbi:hypothetical protein, partial [Gracilibacillus sp. YIM 98692]|uniref:hypothetical protein n=1 Tax=Gracilibacillus sp. YIM 98692 TaxID=2663532 RepID=UPI001969B0CF